MFLCVKKRAKSALIQLILRTRTTALCASPRATDDGCCAFLAIFLFVFFFLPRKRRRARVLLRDHLIKSPHNMGKSSAMRRVIKMSTTHIHYTHARVRWNDLIKKTETMKKESLLFSSAPKRSLWKAKTLFSCAFDIYIIIISIIYNRDILHISIIYIEREFVALVLLCMTLVALYY